jgi:hypothetical protein
LTNTALLEEKITKSGLKKSYIAKAMGLSSYGLALKIQNVHEFKASEIEKMCILLGIDDLEERCAIFFASKVDCKSTSKGEQS